MAFIGRRQRVAGLVNRNRIAPRRRIEQYDGNKYSDRGEFIEKLIVYFQILTLNQIYDQMNHQLFLCGANE